MILVFMHVVSPRWFLSVFRLVNLTSPETWLILLDMDEPEEMPVESAPIEEVPTEGTANNMEDVD